MFYILATSGCVKQIQVLDTMIIITYNIDNESEVHRCMFFGEKLKERREEKNLTQDDVSAFFGEDLTRQAVSKWERGDAYPEVDKLLLLSVKLDISLDELFTYELAYLRKEKTTSSVENSYPGLIAGLKTLANILGGNK